MGLKFTNNAYATLASGITDVATSVALSAGQGARFPALSAGDYFYATLVDSSNNLEIIKVTARSTDTLTVVRGLDGTSGRAYNTGDRLELRPCNAAFQAMQQEAGVATAVSGTDTYTATLAPVPTGYGTNQLYFLAFANTNTNTAPTLNLNSLGAKTIKKHGKAGTAAALVAGDIPPNALLQYDGTDMILLNPRDVVVITRQIFTSGTAATYTTPALARSIRVRMKGGGAAGLGSGTTGPNNGTAGGDTSFNSVVAAGGSIGTSATGAGGLGGTGGTGSASYRVPGAPGVAAHESFVSGTNQISYGGNGGGSGGGLGGAGGSAGANGAAGTGGGGGGGGTGSDTIANLASYFKGPGGGEGEYVELVIDSPAATYTYTVGAGGAGGSAGTSGYAGGDGGSGIIIVDEYY